MTKTSRRKMETNLSQFLSDNARKHFEAFIYPVPFDLFFEKYWEQEPLVIRQNSSKSLETLFSKKQLDHLLESEEVDFGSSEDLCVCNCVDGEKIVYFPSEDCDEDEYMGKDSLDDYFDNKLCTLQIHQPQRYSEAGPLAQLMSRLEDFFQVLVGANVYITPPNAQGLAPHFDDVEVFVVQLEGTKKWKLYSNTSPFLPDECSGDLGYEDIGPPSMEVTLNPGDVLYFPRGTIHEASTADSMSSHLTISTYQKHSWGHFLQHAMHNAIAKAMQEDIELRKGLPVGFAQYMGEMFEHGSLNGLESLQDVFKQKSADHLRLVSSAVDIHTAVDEFMVDFVQSRLPPSLSRDPKDKCFKIGKEARLLSISSFRVQLDEEEETLRIIHACNNNQSEHMIGLHSSEEKMAAFPITCFKFLSQLMNAYLKDPSVFVDMQECPQFMKALVEIGLAEYK